MYSTANLTDVELKDQGNRMFSSRKYDDAINLYTKAIVSDCTFTLSAQQPIAPFSSLDTRSRMNIFAPLQELCLIVNVFIARSKRSAVIGQSITTATVVLSVFALVALIDVYCFV